MQLQYIHGSPSLKAGIYFPTRPRNGYVHENKHYPFEMEKASWIRDVTALFLLNHMYCTLFHRHLAGAWFLQQKVQATMGHVKMSDLP